ncbi:hypothetical protein HYH03_010862 [Edaphochlamys debaryana]|uniref:Uncharacterized protein n=1 Tax=Edaphochlamys debaryana TaxID=47281 RepID=A0A835XYD9_9CHLO|nr:hypothetical protein HYH03_010862 [Edaphochlamys debaryana]|eukprot:KAG2490701.1 hypothetical protein HYH03_010862 [Edaphochlamys debaryana]
MPPAPVYSAFDKVMLVVGLGLVGFTIASFVIDVKLVVLVNEHLVPEMQAAAAAQDTTTCAGAVGAEGVALMAYIVIQALAVAWGVAAWVLSVETLVLGFTRELAFRVLQPFAAAACCWSQSLEALLYLALEHSGALAQGVNTAFALVKLVQLFIYASTLNKLQAFGLWCTQGEGFFSALLAHYGGGDDADPSAPQCRYDGLAFTMRTAVVLGSVGPACGIAAFLAGRTVGPLGHKMLAGVPAALLGGAVVVRTFQVVMVYGEVQAWYTRSFDFCINLKLRVAIAYFALALILAVGCAFWFAYFWNVSSRLSEACLGPAEEGGGVAKHDLAGVLARGLPGGGTASSIDEGRFTWALLACSAGVVIGTVGMVAVAAVGFSLYGMTREAGIPQSGWFVSDVVVNALSLAGVAVGAPLWLGYLLRSWAHRGRVAPDDGGDEEDGAGAGAEGANSRTPSVTTPCPSGSGAAGAA